ncbi:MAG: hypothetical protein ACFCVH_02625 [Alphaproteobacteria bacterium]
MLGILPSPRGFVQSTGLCCVLLLGSLGTAAAQSDFIVLSPDREGTRQTASQTDLRSPEVHRLLDCIFREMGLGYQLAPMPSRRAEMMFDDGLASAILDAFQGPLPDLPSYAQAVMPQQWAWFFVAGSAWQPDDLTFQDRANIAVPGQYGLQQHMQELGFRSVAEASNLPQLVQLLQYRRVDAVLAPSAAFLQTARALGHDDSLFRSEAQTTWHLVVRFRDDYAIANPDVLSGFAVARATCSAR